MVSSNQLQQNYIDLYTQLRNYIWPYRIIEAIANLEIAVFQAFQDIESLRRMFQSLEMDIRDTAKDDEDLQKAINEFRETLNSEDTVYVRLNRVKEVVSE